MVPGIGLSPDKMLLGRVFAYADAQRYRIGPNFHQLPVNQPQGVEGGFEAVNQWMFDGNQAYHHSGTAPVYAPNSFGRESAQEVGRGRWPRAGRPTARWCGRPTRCTPRTTTSARPALLVREVFDDAQRDRLVETVTGALGGIKRGEVLERAIWYWTSVDETIGTRVDEAVKAGRDDETVPGMGVERED